MIRHIVTFRVHAVGVSEREVALARLRTELEALLPLIDDVETLHVGIDNGSVSGHWDAVLVSEHPDYDALGRYQTHAAHVRVLAIVAELVAEKSVVDYEVPAGGR
jgi:hypothetical protein